MTGGFWFFQPSWIVGDSIFFLKQCLPFLNFILKSIRTGVKEDFVKVSVPGLEQRPSFFVFGKEKLCDVVKEEKRASCLGGRGLFRVFSYFFSFFCLEGIFSSHQAGKSREELSHIFFRDVLFLLQGFQS